MSVLPSCAPWLSSSSRQKVRDPVASVNVDILLPSLIHLNSRATGIKALCLNLWSSFEKKLKSCVASLTEHTDELDHEALLSFYEASKAEQIKNQEFREKVTHITGRLDQYLTFQPTTALVRADQRERVLHWLDAPNNASRYEILQSQAMTGTGSWFLQKHEVREFLTSESQTILCVHGALG